MVEQLLIQVLIVRLEVCAHRYMFAALAGDEIAIVDTEHDTVRFPIRFPSTATDYRLLDLLVELVGDAVPAVATIRPYKKLSAWAESDTRSLSIVGLAIDQRNEFWYVLSGDCVLLSIQLHLH